CLLPIERGPCPNHFRRYYYDPASKSCKIFDYGGCVGNGNNFRSRLVCNLACVENFHE
ncbi:hypothetical protein KR093_010228, partial [Drosophila rubida]